MTDPTRSNPSDSYHFSSRVRNPLRVLLAMWRVVKDIRNTEEAGIVEIAFARSRVARRVARWDSVIERMREDASVRDAFKQRRRLDWIDVEELSTRPEGSLGRAFATHLQTNGLDPNLVKVPGDDDVSYFLDQLYQTHDLWHVVSGCGTDEPGELAVGGFYVAQTNAPFFAFLLGLIFFNTAFSRPAQLQARMEGLARGYLAGRNAAPFFGVDWAILWDTPLAQVRRDLGIEEHPKYSGAGIREAA